MILSFLHQRFKIIITVTILSFSLNISLKGQNHFSVSSPAQIYNQQEIFQSERPYKSMRFTPNKGQIANINGKSCSDVLYKGDGANADIYLRKTGISHVMCNTKELKYSMHEKLEEMQLSSSAFGDKTEQEMEEELIKHVSVILHRVDMNFLGCNQNINTINEEEIEGYTNFYYAYCSNGIKNVKSYKRIIYKNVYKNVDFIFYSGKGDGLKYDCIIKPEGNLNDVKISVDGGKKLSINKDGELEIETNLGALIDKAPCSYQVINGVKKSVQVKYILINQNTYGFKVLERYNTAYPLIIDPWITYVGGSKEDAGLAINTDPSGNIAVTGYTASINFPVSAGALFTTFQGGFYDAFIAKFDKNGIRQWITYMGGSGGILESGEGIATDFSGNILVTGSTESGSFPVTIGAFQVVKNPGKDVFVLKLNPAGVLSWSTFLGGSSADNGYGITTDLTGNVIVTGYSQSTNLPVLAAFQGVNKGSEDAFVFKFNPMGNLLWGSYLGGSGSDRAFDVDTDISGDILLTGSTGSVNFPIGSVSPNVVFQGVKQGTSDAFVFKFNAAGNRLWGTFIGGSGSDVGHGIAVDGNNNIVMKGGTASNNFPVTAGAFQGTYNGGVNDGVVVKFTNIGNRLWATFLGGSDNEEGYGVAIDNKNHIFVSGDTYSMNFPVTSCAFQKTHGGKLEDNYLTHFDPDGKVVCSSYVGGIGHDESHGHGDMISVDNTGFAYITGYSDGYPVTPGAFQTIYGGGSSDAFIARLCTNTCGFSSNPVNFTINKTTICAGETVTYSDQSVLCDTSGVTWEWTFTGGTPPTSTSKNPGNISYSSPGSYSVKLLVKSCGKDSLFKNNYVTVSACNCLLTGQFTKGTTSCTGCGCKEWIMVNATGGTSPYTYIWPDGYDKRYKNQLCPGAYTIKVVDKNGCSINLIVNAP